MLGPALTYDRGATPQAPPTTIADAPTEIDAPKVFRPNYAEGYLFALLSSTGYGISPVLVRLALEDRRLERASRAGLISYVAATAGVRADPAAARAMAARARARSRIAAKWFVISGVFVCFAQMLRYMALALAPASVVTPIQRLSLLFRLYFSRIINPQHEVFGGRIIAATVVSLVRRARALGRAPSSCSRCCRCRMPRRPELALAIDWHVAVNAKEKR